MRPQVPSGFLEGLLLTVVAFGVAAFGGVEAWSRAALECGCFALALATFLRGRRASSPAGTLLWLGPAGVAALGLLQLALAAPADGPRPPWPSTAASHDTEQAVRLWAAYAALVWSVPRVLVTAEAARRFATALFGLGAAVAALGLAQSATGTERLYWLRDAGRGATIFGSFYNKDHAATLLLLSLGAGVGLFASRLRGWNDGRPEPGWLQSQFLLGAGVVLVFAGVAGARSQGALLALALGGAAVAFLRAASSGASSSRRLTGAAAAAGVAALAAFLALRHAGAAADAGGIMDRSVSGRLFIYADAWRWWLDAPLFGTGLGSFDAVYPAYQDSTLRARVVHAHSDWIQAAVETGVLGVLVLLLAAAAVAAGGAASWVSARSREARALCGGVLAGTVLVGVHCLVDFSFQIPGVAVAVLAACGFLVSAPSWRDKSGSHPASEPPDRLGAALAAALMLIGSVAAVQPALAEAVASGGTGPGSRLSQAAAAVARHESPANWRRLGAAAHALALARPEPDPELLRLALDASLRALGSRPFDSRSLTLAGLVLVRLQRQADGLEFLERGRRVSFSPYWPRPASAAASARVGLPGGSEPDAAEGVR